MGEEARMAPMSKFEVEVSSRRQPSPAGLAECQWKHFEMTCQGFYEGLLIMLSIKTSAVRLGLLEA